MRDSLINELSLSVLIPTIGNLKRFRSSSIVSTTSDCSRMSIGTHSVQPKATNTYWPSFVMSNAIPCEPTFENEPKIGNMVVHSGTSMARWKIEQCLLGGLSPRLASLRNTIRCTAATQAFASSMWKTQKQVSSDRSKK